MDNREKAVSFYKLELNYDLQTKPRDCVYYCGQTRKDIMLEAINEKVDEILAQFATNAQRAETERQGLTPEPLIPVKKKIIKRKVVN
jgi:hypothetical protein